MSAHTRARRTILWIAAGFLVGVLTTIGFNLGQRAAAISFWGESETPGVPAPTPLTDGRSGSCIRLSAAAITLTLYSYHWAPPQKRAFPCVAFFNLSSAFSAIFFKFDRMENLFLHRKHKQLRGG